MKKKKMPQRSDIYSYINFREAAPLDRSVEKYA